MSSHPDGEGPTGRHLGRACAELERRLCAGGAYSAADVFALYPELAAERHAALELIYTEYVIRAQLGRMLPPGAWCVRFPEWEPDLRELFEVSEYLFASTGDAGP